MRNIVLGCFGVLTMCAALASRDMGSSDGKQSTNKPPNSSGHRSFNDVDESRAALPESSDPRHLTRDQPDVAGTRDPRLLRPEAGEKPNRLTEKVEKQLGDTPKRSRTVLPEPKPDRANRVDRQDGGR